MRMGSGHRRRVRPHGLFQRLLERMRGREQLLVRGGPELPLLLLSYPRGSSEAALELQVAYAHTWPRLSPQARAPYRDVLPLLPALVVVLLRPRNVCDCLGHHHPRGTESRLTLRLAAELGSTVGEVDLAYEAIRGWQPQPLSSLAASQLGPRLHELHFQAALLAVLLHECEHLAIPSSSEPETRARSNGFYAQVMQELVAEECGLAYGMAAPLPPAP